MTYRRELHIVNGSSAAGIIKQAFALPRESLLVHDDLLSCGPLFPLRSISEWQKQREKYLRTLYRFEFSFDSVHRDVLSGTQDLRDAEHLTLWLGTGLAEQLLLAWLIQLFRVIDVDYNKLRIIQFSTDPQRHYEILGIGMLNTDRLKAHPKPSSLDEVAIDSLDRAWNAVTASTPDQLEEFLAAAPGPLPFLQRSLQSLIFRFPDVDSGLSLWDFELLRQVVEKGPTAAKVIGFAIARLIDNLDYVGDAYLFARLKRLGEPSLKQALVSLKGNLAEMRDTEVTETDTGKAVLDGGVNSVVLNGIDDWVGGIHLDSAAGKVWFQSEGVLVDNHPLIG
jgi:Domain of unknown function (DUF1835)